jgi:hypothetical protein
MSSSENARTRERKPEPCTGAASPCATLDPGATQEETTASTYR